MPQQQMVEGLCNNYYTDIICITINDMYTEADTGGVSLMAWEKDSLPLGLQY